MLFFNIKNENCAYYQKTARNKYKDPFQVDNFIIKFFIACVDSPKI